MNSNERFARMMNGGSFYDKPAARRWRERSLGLLLFAVGVALGWFIS